jgi:hypothetical protein
LNLNLIVSRQIRELAGEETLQDVDVAFQ